MLLLLWIGRMLRDILLMAVANRSVGMSLVLLLLLLLGLVIISAQVSAPFIYTLF